MFTAVCLFCFIFVTWTSAYQYLSTNCVRTDWSFYLHKQQPTTLGTNMHSFVWHLHIPLPYLSLHSLSAQLNLLTFGSWKRPFLVETPHLLSWFYSRISAFFSFFSIDTQRRESVICFAIAATMTLKTFSKSVCLVNFATLFCPPLSTCRQLFILFLFLVWLLSAFSFSFLMQLCTAAPFAFFHTEYLLWGGGGQNKSRRRYHLFSLFASFSLNLFTHTHTQHYNVPLNLYLTTTADYNCLYVFAKR